MKFLTQKLIIRTITEQDSQAIFEIRSQPEINQFLHRNPPKNSLEALDFILGIKKKYLNREIFFFGISFINKPKLIGTICLWKISEDRKTAELGYELLPEFQRSGVMSEAVNWILTFGFNDLNLQKIDAFTNKYNVSSIKLLTKFNFKLNEKRKDENFPENLIFELTRS